MRIILLGAPGAGKGTQAGKISRKFNIPHISTGDILRHEIKNGTELGEKISKYVESGELVPDEFIIEIIKNKINSGQLKNGFIMDGFPRNLKQAKMFSEMLDELGIKLDKVINIVVSKDEIISRLNSRRICNSCKSIFSSNDGSNKLERCPKCGGELLKRKDDSTEVIKNRLEVYESETRPLIDFYSNKGLLVDVDGSGRAEDITERILKIL
jgi:adenylate kinase